MKIGIEIELHSNNFTYFDIAAEEWLNFETFKPKDGLMVMMSKEYYESTIEYNFEAHTYSPLYIKKVISFINKQIDKYKLSITNKWPWYVWMHIHIFDLKYRKDWTDLLLQTTMNYLDEHLDNIHKSSFERLIRSHQLWRNYMYNEWDEYLNVLYDYDIPMWYPDYNQDNKKYNPVIISNRSNKGKPRSIEIRLLPNEILLDNSIIYLLERIQKQEYTTCNVMNKMYNWLEKYVWE